jgi:hypothetical protein
MDWYSVCVLTVPPARGRVASLNAKNALRHPCGAGPQGSKTRCGGRNWIDVAALNTA